MSVQTQMEPGSQWAARARAEGTAPVTQLLRPHPQPAEARAAELQEKALLAGNAGELMWAADVMDMREALSSSVLGAMPALLCSCVRTCHTSLTAQRREGRVSNTCQVCALYQVSLMFDGPDPDMA
jgi:hypothetical protein